MPIIVPVHRAETLKGVPPKLMSRIEGNTGGNIVQADITSIELNSFNKAIPGTSIITARNIVVGSTVFDTLQTPAVWTADTIGYNFRYDPTAADFATGGIVHRLVFEFTPAVGEPFAEVWDVDVLDTGV